MIIQPLVARPLYDPFIPVAFTAPPALFEPPPALTDGRREVWLATGGGDSWGGCQIWGALDDDQSYDFMGTVFRGSPVGQLATALPAVDDPDVTSAVIVDVVATRGIIHPGSDAHADRFLTLCWVGGELIAYTRATLVAPSQYRLDRRLRRGAFGTSVKAHPAGTPFARLGLAIFRMPYPAHWVGATVYVKLPAFNEFGLEMQTLDEVRSYSLILTGGGA